MCYVNTMQQLSTVFGNSGIPEAQQHISSDWKFICRKFLQTLQHAASTLTYHSYLKKLQWTNWNADKVYWKVLQMALASFPPNDQCHLVLLSMTNYPFIPQKHTHISDHPYAHHAKGNLKREVALPGMSTAGMHGTFMTLKETLTHLPQKLLHAGLLMSLWLGMVATCNDMLYPNILPNITLLLQYNKHNWDGTNYTRNMSPLLGQTLSIHCSTYCGHDGWASDDQNCTCHLDICTGHMDATKHTPTPPCSPAWPPKL